jgi:hypothetical protein
MLLGGGHSRQALSAGGDVEAVGVGDTSGVVDQAA